MSDTNGAPPAKQTPPSRATPPPVEVPLADQLGRRTRSSLDALARAWRAGADAVQTTGVRLRRWWRHPGVRRAAVSVSLLAVSMVGLSLGLALCARQSLDIGPMRFTLRVGLSLHGGTTVRVPPVGAFDLRSHDGPVALNATLNDLDQRDLGALVNDPRQLDTISDQAWGRVETALTWLAVKSLAGGGLGTALLALAVFRNRRRVVICSALSIVVFIGSGLVALVTLRPTSIDEPRYTGLVTNAPALLGDTRTVTERTASLGTLAIQMLDSLVQVYSNLDSQPLYSPPRGAVAILQVSGVRSNPIAWTLISALAKRLDVVAILDTGDITEFGTDLESRIAANNVSKLHRPYVYVRGPHDSDATARRLRASGATVLDNSVARVAGLIVAGVGAPASATPLPAMSPAVTPTPTTFSSAPPPGPIESEAAGRRLATVVAQFDAAKRGSVGIVLTSDPTVANYLDGRVPLVLAGPGPERTVRFIDDKTLLMVQGATGGDGVTGIVTKQQVFRATALYLAEGSALDAYDDITVSEGDHLGMDLQRYVVPGDYPIRVPLLDPTVPRFPSSSSPVPPSPVPPSPAPPSPSNR